MTVEQRISYWDYPDRLITLSILPGQKSETGLTVVESEHPHSRHSIVFQASCAEDDTHGIITFNHPQAGLIERSFSGESKPYYMIETENGLGVVEWEHRPEGS